MTQEQKQPHKTSLQQVGILFKPKNILRTVASVAPGASALLEIQSQLEDAALDDRITSLEEAGLSVQTKVAQLESSQPKPPVQESNWPAAAADYLRRVVDFAVVYDGKTDPTPRPGREVFLTVAHGCFVGSKTVLTCIEAINTTSEVANYKRGRVAIIAGFSWYEFEVETADKLSGIVTCKITQRDERRDSQTKAKMKKAGLPDSMFPLPLETTIAASIYPWVGQDIGFVYTGEGEDIWRDGMSKFQFDKTSISHFREPREDAIKSFVTAVLPARFLKSGSPAFGGDGTLVGVIADSEHYPSDAGRRAIVRSLLGHPRFTVWPKSTGLSVD